METKIQKRPNEALQNLIKKRKSNKRLRKRRTFYCQNSNRSIITIFINSMQLFGNLLPKLVKPFFYVVNHFFMFSSLIDAFLYNFLTTFMDRIWNRAKGNPKDKMHQKLLSNLRVNWGRLHHFHSLLNLFFFQIRNILKFKNVYKAYQWLLLAKVLRYIPAFPFLRTQTFPFFNIHWIQFIRWKTIAVGFIFWFIRNIWARVRLRRLRKVEVFLALKSVAPIKNLSRS